MVRAIHGPHPRCARAIACGDVRYGILPSQWTRAAR